LFEINVLQNPSTPAPATTVAGTIGRNSPAAAAREEFKHSTDSASLLVPSQKNFSVLGLGFSWGNVTSGGV